MVILHRQKPITAQMAIFFTSLISGNDQFFYSPVSLMKRLYRESLLHSAIWIFVLLWHRSSEILTMTPSQLSSMAQAYWHSDKERESEYGLGSKEIAPFPV